MGKNCWLLLPDYKTDWRWLTGRSDSPGIQRDAPFPPAPHGGVGDGDCRGARGVTEIYERMTPNSREKESGKSASKGDE